MNRHGDKGLLYLNLLEDLKLNVDSPLTVKEYDNVVIHSLIQLYLGNYKFKLM